IQNFKEYMDGMRKLISKAEAEERKFFKDYPGWIEEAQRIHGKLFDRSQFPTVDEVKGKFGIHVNVIPIPSVEDWRIQLDAEQVKELKRAALEQFEAINKEGLAELYERIHKVLEHANEKLSDAEATFRNSTIENLKEITKAIAKLNITG